MAAATLFNDPILQGTERLMVFFNGNETELSLKELVKKNFFSTKKDLNLVLYTLLDHKFVEKKEKPNSSPIWQKKADTELTDEFKRAVKESVISKLAKRPTAVVQQIQQLNIQNLQIGDNNQIIRNEY